MTKGELLDLQKEIYSRREDAGIQLVLKFLNELLEVGAKKLVDDCTPENFPIVQGTARAYKTLINMISKPVPDITQKLDQ